MNNEVLSVQFINAKNCFLHFSPQRFRSVVGPTVFGLKLITSAGREFYFSPNPVPCSWVVNNCVGISHKYAKAISLNENEEVIVTSIYNIGSLQSISVTPRSEDDYEILHSTAQAVESSLLNQLRVVWPKQVFPVWVSSNISVTLVVDSVSPNLRYGRLEEYSEVSISTVLPSNGPIKTDLPNGNNYNTKSFNNIKEQIIIPKTLKFRCVPLNGLYKNQCKFNYNPYVVFSKKSTLPSWAIDILCSNKKSVWKLRNCFDVSKSVAVNLAFSDETELEEEDIDGIKSLFVSPLLLNFIDIDLGHKVTLDLISEPPPEISGILISPSTEIDEKKILNEINDLFREAVSFYGNILLNTKAPYPLKKGTCVITLRPLHADWGFITIDKLRNLTINVNKFLSDNVTPTSGYSLNEEKGCCLVPSFQSIIDQGRIATELSLSLKSSKLNKRFCDNVIFTGKSGSGKTVIVKYLMKRIRGPPFYVHTKYISCCSLKGKRVEALSKYLTDVLKSCSLSEPTVLFLDDLDLLASMSQEHTEAAFHINRISHKIVELMELCQRRNWLSIVATAKSLEHMNPKVYSNKGKCLFTTVIQIPDLDKDDRLELVKHLIFQTPNLKVDKSIDYEDISLQSEGYTPLDIKKICDKAIFEAWHKKGFQDDQLPITTDNFKMAFQGNKPSSLQNISFYKGSKTSWKDVGGLKKVKDKLIEVMCWPTMFAEILKQCPVKAQTGVLLYGAPGTGKTLLASALAAESKMNFISIKGPELMSKYIGESEEGVRKLFEKAQAARPCLLFFDEFDSLAPRRGQDQTGVTDRVVNQLLTALDGVEPMSGVWVLAATSRPDLIDPAVLRPGRIGISVFCSLPDEDERLEIIKVLSSKISLSDDINIEELSKSTIGFTGADIKGLFTSAQIKALDNFLNEQGLPEESEENKNSDMPVIELRNEHITEALKEIKPSLSETDIMKYDAIYSQFEKRTPVNIKEQRMTHA